MKKLTVNELKDVVYNYPTKHKEGFTYDEITALLKEYDIDRSKFNDISGVNTCMSIGEDIIHYHSDIELALRCLIEKRQKNSEEWD